MQTPCSSVMPDPWYACQHVIPFGHVAFSSQGNEQIELHAGLAVPLCGCGQSSADSHS